VQLYTESCTDMTLPYAGRYCEWTTGGLAGTSNDTYTALRFLCPRSLWLCMDRTGRHELPDYIKAGLTPLVPDTRVDRMPASRPVKLP